MGVANRSPEASIAETAKLTLETRLEALKNRIIQ
jgi:hypothetical protein